MFSIELSDLDAHQLQREVLAAIEEICFEFHLEDHFGTLSFSIHELLDQIIEHFSDEYSQTDISFYITHEELSVLVHHSVPLSELKTMIEDGFSEENPSIFTIRKLVDKIEFSNQDQDISLMFHVKSVIDRVGERELDKVSNLLTEEEIAEEKKRDRQKK